ncbi:putative TonB family protein [Acidobacteriia bacterium SbA2]|nr:putative TonB family protein [Acidobacteriia bacterium SbA2]
MSGIFSPFLHVLQSLHGFTGKGLALLLDAALKGTCLLLLCGALVSTLRRASAAARHLVWSLGVGAILALPFFSLMLPAWDVPVISTLPTYTAGERGVTKVDLQVVQESSQIDVRPMAQVAPVSGSSGEAPFRTGWVLCLWAIGAALLAARTAVGECRVRRIARRSLPFETRQAKVILENVRSSLRLSRAVRLRTSAEVAVPFTHGVLRPAVLLPAEAPQWSRQQLEWVLTHELAHVRRNDYLTQMSAQVVCALLWFHPLVWLAGFAMRKERERACDDIVLSLGHPATDYAEFLLVLSRALQGSNGAWSTSVAMAQSSQLEVRMKALLDPRLNHKPLAASRALLTAALSALLLLPVAAMRVAAKSASGTISGTVRDPSGAVIPNANVSLVNVGLKSKIEGHSGPDGTFSFAAIPPGSYRLEIACPGFAFTKSAELDLQSGGDLHQNITLDIGEVLEEVVVHGHKPAESPAAPRPAPRRIRVGGNVQAAHLISQVKPEYPEALEKQGIEGAVILRAVIGTSGQILSLSPFSDPDPALTKAAMDAVRQWRYTPTLLNGEPVEVVTTITVGFRLDE